MYDDAPDAPTESGERPGWSGIGQRAGGTKVLRQQGGTCISAAAGSIPQPEQLKGTPSEAQSLTAVTGVDIQKAGTFRSRPLRCGCYLRKP